MFKKRTSKKVAIRVTKTYDGVSMPDTYVIKTEKYITDIIQHIESNSDVYSRYMASEDGLTGLPHVKINKLELGFVPNEPEIPVVATVDYSFKTAPHIKKKRPIISAVLILLAAVIIFNVFFFTQVAAKERIRAMCKIYYQHGKATHIMLGDKEFDINNMTEKDYLFLNPWEQEILANTEISECLRIDRR